MTLNRDLDEVRQEQATWTSEKILQAMEIAGAQALRWDKTQVCLSLTLFSNYAIQLGTCFPEHLTCGGMGQRAGEIMESTRPNFCPQEIHRLAGETDSWWTQPDGPRQI